jgi:hypothetical protein
MSVTLTPELRRLLRIAAAEADLTTPQWCQLIVSEAAARTVQRLHDRK